MSRAQLTSTVEQNSAGAASPYVGAKNFLANGGMDIWQRSTSSASTGGYYTADRWYQAAAGTTTISQDTDVPTGVNAQYSIKWVTSASSSYGQFYQALEQAVAKPLRGQKVTASVWVKTSSYGSGSLILRAEYSNTTDALISQSTFISDGSATGSSMTSWTKITNTFTVPSDAVGLRISLIPDAAQGSGVTVKMTGAQLEVGSVATPFSRAGGTLQGELAACQYYYRVFGAGCIGINESSTSLDYQFIFDGGGMRIAPSLSLYSTSANNFNWGVGTTAYTISSITGNTITNKGGYISLNTSNSGISTAGKVVTLLTNNFAASSEL
jgi:hypothetical protein